MTDINIYFGGIIVAMIIIWLLLSRPKKESYIRSGEKGTNDEISTKTLVKTYKGYSIYRYYGKYYAKYWKNPESGLAGSTGHYSYWDYDYQGFGIYICVVDPSGQITDISRWIKTKQGDWGELLHSMEKIQEMFELQVKIIENKIDEDINNKERQSGRNLQRKMIDKTLEHNLSTMYENHG
jgi:hypothetical protein